MTGTTINPIDGLSPKQIIDIFCNGSGYDLEHLKEKAVYVVDAHIKETAIPTVQSTLHALLESKDLDGFVSIVAKCFLPDVNEYKPI